MPLPIVFFPHYNCRNFFKFLCSKFPKKKDKAFWLFLFVFELPVRCFLSFFLSFFSFFEGKNYTGIVDPPQKKCSRYLNTFLLLSLFYYTIFDIIRRVDSSWRLIFKKPSSPTQPDLGRSRTRTYSLLV